MSCLTSLCRRHTSSRRPDVLGAMRGLFFWHTAPAVCRPPAAPHIQNINRVIARPPALRQVLTPPTRHYCTILPRSVIHFTHRPSRSRWYSYPRKVVVATAPLIIVGIGGAVIAADHGYLETVPCTNRTHFVLRTHQEEREYGESRFANLKERCAAIILDPHHPKSVRVNNITSKLVHAIDNHLVIKSHDTVMLHRGSAESAIEVLRRKLGINARPATGHLNGLKWEVIVVKKKRVAMWSYPAGKIIVPSGLLLVFNTEDAEVAFMIAHEIAHIVARHWSESIIYKWLPRPLRMPFTRRAEREADQIGMMILAAAGFDPRIAPLTFKKLGDSNRRFFSTHPSNKKRSQLLSEPKIIEAALELYRVHRESNPDTEGSL